MQKRFCHRGVLKYLICIMMVIQQKVYSVIGSESCRTGSEAACCHNPKHRQTVVAYKFCMGRWFTSWFIHHSFEHITSNMALFLVVAYQIEEKYGTWRITILYFMSALGGTFRLIMLHCIHSNIAWMIDTWEFDIFKTVMVSWLLKHIAAFEAQ